MNNESLQQLTEQLAIEHFGIPFKHHIYFNRRLRTTGGRYMLTSHDIEINPKQYEHFGEQALVDIIKHELCHYFLHLSGRGHQHKDRDFKVLAEKVGAPRFCQPTESYASRANYEYECQSCHSSYVRIRKVNVVKMRCGRCGGRLKLKRYL
ncbi:TPA: SprT family protein [Staphylococcus delphini]|uniref:SprT family protein n=1 Tax=Staphylococcus delphini TaxID=53344 RepID=UPI0023B337AF|nr:SprT family protein [Staphylococcus delphini]MDE9799059.1 SprT family protein [Staphylococcus delphini]MDE9806387.1 SprT family protein [Staphylococcus delphini]HEC2149241.1 SprT family protein [Staphylococcus delphini]HEC2187255.1 SprT family protein [Staphylococcus delphini]HEC2193540.1 SprT family protein [Staphylococcus delphini]